MDKEGIKFKTIFPLFVSVENLSPEVVDKQFLLSTLLIVCGKDVHKFCGQVIYHGDICGKCGKDVHKFCGKNSMAESQENFYTIVESCPQFLAIYTPSLYPLYLIE